jgi:glycosyltransferase involved in cell wall biosynthesis
VSAPSRDLAIGVVVGVHNQAAFLGEALDSVVAQTVPPAQVIVVDNASSDGSGDIARARGYRVLEIDGRAPGATRNRGAAALDTPLLAFLDGDDRYTPSHHAALAAGLGDADVACGCVAEFLDPAREAELRRRYAVDPSPRQGRHAGSTLIRREAFVAAGGFGQDEARHEVLDLFRRLAAPAEVPETVLERRIHGSNRTIVMREELRAQYLATARAAIEEHRRRS